jgi:hypothetical protein
MTVITNKTSLSDVELYARKKFIQTSKITLETIKSGMNEKKVENIDQVEVVKQKMIDQDRVLDEISVGVKTLKEVGKTIDITLTRHDDIITDIDKKMDISDTRLVRANKQVHKLLEKTKCRWDYVVIAALAFILLLLFVALFYI